MATKNVLSLIDSSVYGSRAESFISQINANGVTHAVAVERGIRFYNGQADDTGILWTGATGLEVVIPNIADLVTDPVRFVGTVDAQGNVKDGDTTVTSFSKGDLVYITTNGTSFGGQTCEAGDMAVCTSVSGSTPTWAVIQGENQVRLDASGTVAISGVAKDIITVEGQTVALAIDYNDVANKLQRNSSNEISVLNGTVAVSSKYVTLSQGADASLNIATEKSITYGTDLSDGTVTINEKVLTAAAFSFEAGTLPSATANSASIEVPVSVSHNLSISFGEGNDVVTAVTAIQSVDIVAAQSSANAKLAFVTGLSAAAGTEFVSGLRDKTVDDSAADLTVWGQVTNTGISTFVSGLGEGSDVVTSIAGAKGAVSLVSGNDILTGLSDGNDVITRVSVGYAAQSSDEWFLTGLTEGSAVVTSVSFGEIAVAADNNISSNLQGEAITTASVSNHVLSFSTGSFMKPVSITLSGTGTTMSGFSKGGVQISGTEISAKGFTKSALSQADVTVSYGGLLTGSVNLSQGSSEFVFTKAADHNYTAVMDYKDLSFTDATITKGTVALANTAITASGYVPESAVLVSLSAGTLPSLSIADAAGTLTGSVNTTLSTSTLSWLAIDETKAASALPGAYSLVEVSAAGEGVVTVAAAADYAVEDATVTIPADTYVTGISVPNA